MSMWYFTLTSASAVKQRSVIPMQGIAALQDVGVGIVASVDAVGIREPIARSVSHRSDSNSAARVHWLYSVGLG